MSNLLDPSTYFVRRRSGNQTSPKGHVSTVAHAHTSHWPLAIGRTQRRTAHCDKMQSKSVFQFLTLSGEFIAREYSRLIDRPSAVVLFPSCVAVNVCAGDDATFTCQTNATTITWAITPPAPEATTSCLALRGPPLNVITPSCGEMDEFTIEVSSAEDGVSTLSTESIAADLNGTRIRCLDGDFDSEVCIRGMRERSAIAMYGKHAC